MLRREIRTSIDIDAPPARVWQVLTDFPHYSEWNNFLHWVEGEIAHGERIRYCFELPRGFRFVANAKIHNVTSEKELRWVGVLFLGALFRGEHYFQIEP